jgi:hypothetical protein
MSLATTAGGNAGILRGDTCYLQWGFTFDSQAKTCGHCIQLLIVVVKMIKSVPNNLEELRRILGNFKSNMDV